MNTKNIGFIGTGNMGTPMIKSLAKCGEVDPKNIYIFDIDSIKTDALKCELGIQVVSSEDELVKVSDIVILAVKPNICPVVLDKCKGSFNDGKILVSIAAGVPISAYKEVVGDNIKCVRTMPNTPAQVGEGLTVICPDAICEAADIELITEIFKQFGKTVQLKEESMNSVIALTGSSPAYVFMFIEAMGDAAVQAGLPRDIVYGMAAQAVLGSAKLVLETGEHPAVLKDKVCSPAGTTIEAVAKLEENGFRNAIIEAMNACTDKANNM